MSLPEKRHSLPTLACFADVAAKTVFRACDFREGNALISVQALDQPEANRPRIRTRAVC